MSVVATASNADRDIVLSYNLQASCYVTKHVDFDQFLLVVQAVEHFGLCVMTLAEQPASVAVRGSAAVWR